MITKFLPSTSGVYFIQNKENGKRYIGSSNNIKNRVTVHRSYLRSNAHANQYLQNAWNLSGENSFICGVLYYCDKQNLAVVEQHCIDNLKPEYNITIEVIRNTPAKESIEKSKATIKRKREQGLIISGSVKEVYQYSLEGTYLQSFKSIEEAAKEVNCHRSTIDRAIHGQPGKDIRTGKGFQWRLEKVDKLSKIEMINLKQRKRYRRTKKEIANALVKQGELLETPTKVNQQPS